MFFRHSVIYLLARGLPSLIAFLSIAIYTRLLNPEEFGLYTLVYTAATLLSSIVFQWLRLGLLRYYQGKNKEQRVVLISTIAISFAAIAVFVCFLWVPITMFMGHAALMALVLLISIVQGCFDILLEKARVELSPLRFGIIALMRSVLMLAGGVMGFQVDGVKGLLIGILIGLLAIVFVEIKRTAWMVSQTRASKEQVWQLLQFGGPLTASFALVAILGFSDRYMLAWMQSTSTAGTYSATYDLTQKTILVLMLIINLAGYPLIIKAHTDSNFLDFKKKIRLTLNGLLFVSLPILIIFEAFPTLIASAFLGDKFHQGASILMPWLAIAAVLEGMKVFYFDLSFQLSQRTIHLVWIVALAAFLNVGLNYWLIPTYGELGAAWTTLAANILGLGLSFGVSRFLIRLPIITRESILIILAATMMIGFIWAVRPWFSTLTLVPLLKLLLVSIFSGGVYFLGILIFNVFGIRSYVATYAARHFSYIRSYIR